MPAGCCIGYLDTESRCVRTVAAADKPLDGYVRTPSQSHTGQLPRDGETATKFDAGYVCPCKPITGTATGIAGTPNARRRLWRRHRHSRSRGCCWTCPYRRRIDTARCLGSAAGNSEHTKASGRIQPILALLSIAQYATTTGSEF